MPRATAGPCSQLRLRAGAGSFRVGRASTCQSAFTAVHPQPRNLNLPCHVFPFEIRISSLSVCLALAVIGVTSYRRCRWICSRPSTCRKWWSQPSIAACRRRISKQTSPIRSSASSHRQPASTIMESRSLLGVSIIKVYFQPGTQRRRRRDPALQPGTRRPEAPAARYPAARGPEVRCLQSAGLPGDGQRRRAQRRRSFTTSRNSRFATRSPS